MPPQNVSNKDVNQSQYKFVKNVFYDQHTFVASNSTMFNTWTLSDTTMPRVNSYQWIIYEPKSYYPECVFLFGGFSLDYH